MHPHEFGKALSVTRADTLRQAAALAHLTAGDLSRELFKGNLASMLERAIYTREQALAHLSREQLVLLTLARLMERLGVPLRALSTRQAVLDAAEDVAEAALHRLRTQENFPRHDLRRYDPVAGATAGYRHRPAR